MALVGVVGGSFDFRLDGSTPATQTVNISCVGIGAMPGWSITSVVGGTQTEDDHGTASISNVGFLVYFHAAGTSIGTGNRRSTKPILPVPWQPWLLSVPEIASHRSLQTDVGSFVIQNISGDSLSRDAEKLLRASAFEGAEFIYRSWQADAEAGWREVHGTLKVTNVGVDTLTLAGKQTIDPSQADTPLEIYCETCQLQWGGPRCGATEATECSYNYQTCQQPNRIMVLMNNYEKNYGENPAATALNVINRRRVI